jgi:hypothetical protein
VAAARERRREPERQRRERLLNELRTLLASARLAGLSRAQIETLFAEQASAIWPEE